MTASFVIPKTYRVGVIAIGASCLINSVGGLIVRSTESSTEWQLIMMRATSLAAALLVIFAIQTKGKILAGFWVAGRWALFGGLMVTTANIGIIHSFQHTTVANTLFVLSATPLATAVLARIFLGERVRRATCIAMMAAVFGITLMVRDGIVAGTLFGNAMALMTMLAFSSFMVILRHGRTVNMLPAVIFGASLSAVISIVVSEFDFVVSTKDLTLCFIWGGVISAVVHVLFTFGSRLVLGVEMALLTLLEFVAGPVWVWLFADEIPSQMTIIGGFFVLGAVAGRAIALAKVPKD